LSVALVDVFLSRERVTPEKVQLVGIACLFIAAKYEQRIILSVSKSTLCKITTDKRDCNRLERTQA
jgi:Cyclin, N-terminal domain